MSTCLCALAALLLPLSCCAWSGHATQEGNLRVVIGEVPEVTALDVEVPFRVSLENLGETQISGTAQVRDLVDATRLVGPGEKSFNLPPRGKTELDFTVSFGPGTHSALYPLHVYVDFTQDGQALTAHAVRIVTTRLVQQDRSSPDPTPMAVNVVPERGALPLWTLRTHRVVWQYCDGPPQYKPAGWTGGDAVSRAHMDITWVTRGEGKSAIVMHPPWVPGGGTIFCDYLLQLPPTAPLKLTFAHAIRDNTPQEPPSDGVWFRVWVAEGVEGRAPEQLYQRFTASKVWVQGEVDLSRYAGKTVLLRLESHPGPRKDTTCDSSFWAEPTVVAGQPPAPRGAFSELAADNVQTGRRLLAGTLQPDGKWTFLVGHGEARTAVVFRPTDRGILDAVWSVVGPRSAVSFDGFTLDILGQHAVRWPTAIAFRSYHTEQRDGMVAHIHQLEREGKPLVVTLSLWVEGDGLRVRWEADERVTDFSIGAADQPAPVVYYGHGYRIVNPRAFRAWFGGHDLSTSHVGCDFEGGMSLLQAVDVPPDAFEVVPEAHTYALHTHMNGTLTLVAGERGALDCALRYRPLFDKPPAGGVARLAGRYCFDIWGGRYADIADNMAEMIRYGLTDSFLTVHAWQRWGYDYRLPDIWPPDPSLGTVEDMRRIAETCKAYDIPWGLHDNYIDFYPDAEGYTYDRICFTEDGQPIRAWYNEGRQAQSYRWRPDCIMPFVQRNLRLIKEGVAPTHYFIDVFTSIGCFDFFDREGRFHPSTETRQRWGEVFAWIREYLGGDAPTTSEAGHDQLIGFLDGADCQHMPLNVRCDDWEKVPWFDAVNHHRFIQHGVGYSGRYEGGRGRRDHGINSDDYISCEILEGHALMTDAASWGPAAVRKYWLAQHVARNLALQEITSIQLVDADMHRQIVTWGNGTRVYVNRGEQDWVVEDHVLPKYGFAVLGPSSRPDHPVEQLSSGTVGVASAAAPSITASIERRDGVICESSTAPNRWYCNARTWDPELGAGIEPHVEGFRYLGENRFSWDVVWEAQGPAPRDLRVFVHFCSDQSPRADKIVFQDDHQPPRPTTEWHGLVRYPRTITVPDSAKGDYIVLFGLYDEAGRLPLRGREGPQGGNTVWVGTLTVKREGGDVATINFAPPPPPPAPPEPSRLNLDRKVLDFGFAATDGAFRVERTGEGLRLTPLPDSPPFKVTLRLRALGYGGRRVAKVIGVHPAGWRQRGTRPPGSMPGGEPDEWRVEVPFAQTGDDVAFQHGDWEVFCYEVELMEG